MDSKHPKQWLSRGCAVINVTFDPRNPDIILLQDDNGIYAIDKNKVRQWGGHYCGCKWSVYFLNTLKFIYSLILSKKKIITSESFTVSYADINVGNIILKTIEYVQTDN